MRVRDALLDDAPVIAEIYRVYVEESVASFEDVAPDGLQMATRMQVTPRLPWVLAEDPAGHIVGYAYASRHRARAAYRWAVDCFTPHARAPPAAGTDAAPLTRRLRLLRVLTRAPG